MKRKAIQTILFLLILALPLGRRHIFWDLSPQIAGNWSPFAEVAIFGADIVAFLLLVLIVGYGRELRNPTNKWVLAYFLWSLVVYLITPRGTFYDTYIILKTLEILTIFVIFSFVSRDRIYFSTILWAFSISGLVQALIAGFQFATQHSLGLTWLGETPLDISIQGLAKIQTGSQLLLRPYGTVNHPNQLAAFILVACATSIYLLITQRNLRAKIFAAVSVLILTFAEFLTFSRAGIGALVIMFFLFLFFYYKEHSLDHELKSLFLILLIALAIPVTSLFPILSSRATLVDNATLNRIEYDKAGLNIFTEHPVVGVGLGKGIFAMAQKMPNALAWEVQPPHNFFIDVAYETGVISLVLFVVALIYLFWKLIKSGGGASLKRAFAIALLTAIVFLMMFDHYFYDLPQTQLLLWIILGIITGIVSQETVIEKI